uniref:Uncharacterized protein n=1 Tax=Anguilla anguilla TaxID=7936 RepID=A0A0E9Q005_ANGAN
MDIMTFGTTNLCLLTCNVEIFYFLNSRSIREAHHKNISHILYIIVFTHTANINTSSCFYLCAKF